MELSDALDIGEYAGEMTLKVYTSKRETPRIIRNLEGNDAEQVVLQRFSKYWNKKKRLDRPDGLFVVTTHRVLFLAKQKEWLSTNIRFMSTGFLSFPFECVQGFEEARVWGKVPAITLTVEGEPYTFTLLSNSQEVFAAIAKYC